MLFGSPFRSTTPPPASTGAPKSPAVDAEYQRGEPTGRGLILVIDDSPLILKVVTRTLRTEGFVTLTAESGVAGILKWEKHKDAVSLILSDVFMPGIDGLTLGRELRSRKCTRPIILMSSKLDDNSRWIAEEAGFQLIQKPFKDEELLELIAAALG